MADLYQGTINYTPAKVWDSISGQVIGELKRGDHVEGYLTTASGLYVRLVFPVTGYTKKAWITGWAIKPVTPPLPPPPPPDPEPVPVVLVPFSLKVAGFKLFTGNLEPE